MDNKTIIAHHNPLPIPSYINYEPLSIIRSNPERAYGVQQGYRMLSKGQLNRHYALLRGLLKSNLGLNNRERDVTFALLRFFVYYGMVYPKAKTIAEDCYLSKRTFWYAVKKLESMGLVERNHQYMNGYQTSNLYRLDKLAILAAQYLAEHGKEIVGQGKAILQLFSDFWREIWGADVLLPGDNGVKLKFSLTR